MMDDREDKFDEFLREAARDYNAPPEAPKALMWERIKAERAVARPAGILPLRRPAVRLLLAIAAVLLLGVAIGRLTAPTSVAPSMVAATPDSTPAGTPVAVKPERGRLASQLATEDHLSQVEMFLTEFDTQPTSPDFTDQARDLLGTTRLLLDSKRVPDARTRKLLEDLELVLVQIATLNPKGRREDLSSIADGLAQNHLRTRLRNAIPTGSAIRM